MTDTKTTETETPKIEVGTIYYTCWGYDQTNTEFFQVVRKTEKTVWVRELESKLESDGKLSMSGRVLPIKDKFANDEIFRKKIGHKGSISFSSYRGAWLWDGTSKSVSFWA